MDSICSRLAYFAKTLLLPERKVGLAVGQLSLLQIKHPTKLFRLNRQTSFT